MSQNSISRVTLFFIVNAKLLAKLVTLSNLIGKKFLHVKLTSSSKTIFTVEISNRI